MACFALCGCTSPGSAFSLEPAPLPTDPLLASALIGRGSSIDERERIAVFDRKQDWVGLQRYAEEGQRRDPGGSDWEVVAAYAWLRRGEYPKATSALSRVIQRNPEDIGAWNLLGESQRLAGQPSQAVRTLERGSAIGRTSFATFFLLGEAYRDARRLDRAILAYREAGRLEPEFARTWFELGVCYVRLRERDELPAVLERLEKLDPALAQELKKRMDAGPR